MLKTRIIARLDIKGQNLIKPINLEGLRIVGDPEVYARGYDKEGVDELLFMDAVASLYGRNNLESLVERVSQRVFCPITVGGGIRSIEDASKMLRAGADKVAINTAAIKRPELITEISEKFGSQCMVLQVDAKKADGFYEVYIDGGREKTGRNVTEWVEEATALGAGEILLTSIDHEGTRKGYDLDLIKAIKTNIPVVASGGCGNPMHCVEAIKAGADAVACADILHYRRHSLEDIRELMEQNNIPIRRVA
jgi:cyclase